MRRTTWIPPVIPQGEVLVYHAISIMPRVLFEVRPPGFAVVQ